MTDEERLRAGIVISLFAHFLLFTTGWRTEEPQPAFTTVVQLDMDSAAVNPESRPGLGVSLPSPEAREQAQLADRKRKAFLRFLEDVGDAVHARRFVQGGTDLIGVATISFLIHPDGRFSEPVISESSGQLKLDAAALAAVRSASAVAKRPAIIGNEAIPVTLQVKYQYGLR